MQRRRFIATGAVLALSLIATGCGGDSTADPPGGSATTSPQVLAQAEAIVAQAKTGLVRFEGREGDVTLEKIKPFSGWSGPGTSPKPVPSASIDVIACSFGSSCEEVGKRVIQVAESLGWKGTLRDGQGSPEGFQKAMSTSIASKPDAVITVAIPENQIADGIADLHQDKVPVVGISAVDEGGTDGYDVRVSGRETFLSALEAAFVIADSKGKGKALYLWLDGFPHLVEARDVSTRVLKECGGCTLLGIENRTIQQFTDPVEMASITNALIQRHGKNLEYLVLPGGFGAPYVIEALRAAGREDVKVVTKNAEPDSLGSVAEGKQPIDFGAVRGWNAYAAIDQTNRLLSGQKALPDDEQGIPATAFTKDTSPKDGVVDWAKYVDYPSYYKKMWEAAR